MEDMKTSKFKTTAKCGGCVAKIEEYLNRVVSRDQWNVDLTSQDRVLTVTSDVPDEEIMRLVREAGFQIERMI